LKERRPILSTCEEFDLANGTVLSEAEEPFQHIYFPLGGLISLVTTTDGHEPLGLAMIGNEGALGSTVALGVNMAWLRAVVQGSGTCLRMTAAQLRRALGDSPGLVSALKRYSYLLMGQLLRTAACNSFHEVEMRLARYLLMTDDRTATNQFHLTHQMLADLLGVQRSAVTIAAGKLQRRKLIGYARGQISILSRDGLEDAACGCYRSQLQ
jgi:CRP-like cAMP-binding protein